MRLLAYKKSGVHIEVTDLLVPKFGDSMDDLRKLVRWIADNLGAETPFHILRFFPTYKMSDTPPTPIETLEKAFNIAKEELKYVYIGNAGQRENTYCPVCGTLSVERTILGVTAFNLKKDLKCLKCGNRIPIAGMKWVPKNLLK